MNRDSDDEKTQHTVASHPLNNIKIFNQNISKAFLPKIKTIIPWAEKRAYDIICLTDSETPAFMESGLPEYISTSWVMIGYAPKVCMLAFKNFLEGRVVPTAKIFANGRGIFVSFGPNLSICTVYQQQGVDSWPEDSPKLDLSAAAHSLYTEFLTISNGYPNVILCGDFNETVFPADRFNQSRAGSTSSRHRNRLLSRLMLEGFRDVASLGGASILYDYPPTTGPAWGTHPPPLGHFTMIQRAAGDGHAHERKVKCASRIDQFWIKGFIVPASLSISDTLVKSGYHLALSLSASFPDTRDTDWELQSPFSQPILCLDGPEEKNDLAALSVMRAFDRSPGLALASFLHTCRSGPMQDNIPLTEELLTTALSSAGAVLGLRYHGVQPQDQSQARLLRRKVKKLRSLISFTRHILPEDGFHHPRLREPFFNHLDGPWANDRARCIDENVQWGEWLCEVRRQFREAKALLCALLSKGNVKNHAHPTRTPDDRFFRKLSKRRAGPIDHLVEDGRVVVGKDDLDSHITRYYSNVFSTQDSVADKPSTAAQPHWLTSTIPTVPIDHYRRLLPDRSLSCDEVSVALRNANDSAPGLDRLNGSFWRMVLLSLDKHEDKTLRDTYLSMITALFNSWLRLGDIPCKLMEVLLIQKKKDKGITLNNLRPITLQSSLLKIFKGILCSHIAEFVDPLLCNQQSGARKGHSSQEAVMEFVQRLTNAKAKSRPAHSLLIDLRKAFDRVPHWALRRALERLSLPDWIVGLLMNSLRGTAVIFRTKWGHSPQVPINRGIPQGDPLSALLFVIFLDSLLVSLQQDDLLFPGLAGDARASLILAYMDDLTLSADSNSRLQHLARGVERWCEFMGMAIAPEKSIYMVTGGHLRDINTPLPPDSSLLLAGLVLTPIPSVQPFRLLGLWMTSELDFAKQLAKLDTQVSLACHTALAHHLSPAETRHWLYTYLYSRLRWSFAIIPFPMPLLQKWDMRTTRVLRKTTTYMSADSRRFLRDPPRLMSGEATHSAFDLQSIKSLYSITFVGECYIRLGDSTSGFSDQCYETKASCYKKGVTSLKAMGIRVSKAKSQLARNLAVRRVHIALVDQIDDSVREIALEPVYGNKPRVIYTDGSHLPSTHSLSSAVVWIDNHGNLHRVGFAWRCPSAPSSFTAEHGAHLLAEILFPPPQSLHFFSDADTAAKAVTGVFRSLSHRRQMRSTCHPTLSLCDEFELKRLHLTSYTHVKGHSGDFLNDTADKKCTALQRAYRIDSRSNRVFDELLSLGNLHYNLHFSPEPGLGDLKKHMVVGDAFPYIRKWHRRQNFHKWYNSLNSGRLAFKIGPQLSRVSGLLLSMGWRTGNLLLQPLSQEQQSFVFNFLSEGFRFNLRNCPTCPLPNQTPDSLAHFLRCPGFHRRFLTLASMFIEKKNEIFEETGDTPFGDMVPSFFPASLGYPSNPPSGWPSFIAKSSSTSPALFPITRQIFVILHGCWLQRIRRHDQERTNRVLRGMLIFWGDDEEGRRGRERLQAKIDAEDVSFSDLNCPHADCPPHSNCVDTNQPHAQTAPAAPAPG
jgi:hypothetical protein